MTTNRVAITGMGTICSLGHNLQDVWSNIKEGKPGISKITEVELDEKLAIKIAGEVKNFSLSEDILPAKEHARYDRFIQFALHSAEEALKHAGLKENSPYDRERMGSILGVGIGGFPEIEKTARNFIEKGPRRIGPFFIPGIIPNMTSGMMSIQHNLQGLNYSISSACASAAHAISASAFEIMTGRQDVMVSGGAEAVVCNLGLGGFISMRALSKRQDEPEKASRPFDKDRDGFVMGEGAGILILENLEKAKARGATIYAEIVGHGATSDAYHISAPHPEGEGAMRCMKMALNHAGIKPEEVGYVNAHGTSTPLGDAGETNAIKKTFGEHAYNMAVSSTKSMTGHLLGAAGGIETIFCAMALHEGVLPPTINLDNPDEACDLDYVSEGARKKQVEYALNNSFGFGSTNASLVLKRYAE
ncbi:beta-ketoacyl-ACP synthase II [Halobacteriovorax sp. GB3]|uniref:beta-ketoacyl-ACP synthase II n=1 Tax=Halobacteriovorax sp. GB3 TaxID=2719615 RepID=UPI0023601909|nr:beta-ketoacyl-ACP synthase II [Halobacteriovorax sp. GB3]MDD0853966.1 beta-ketoacyl-ACP synthase II [Halobacteriovorax sp. GB3]